MHVLKGRIGARVVVRPYRGSMDGDTEYLGATLERFSLSRFRYVFSVVVVASHLAPSKSIDPSMSCDAAFKTFVVCWDFYRDFRSLAGTETTP